MLKFKPYSVIIIT